MALKDGTTSKSIARTSSLEAGTSLLKSYWKSSLILLSFSCYPARILLEIESNPIHPMLTAAASSHALKTAPQRSPSGRLRNSQTPWPWRTERPPNQSQEQVPWMPERPFWNPTRNLLLSCYRARILSYPAILLFRNTAETAKHHLISCRKWRKINHKNKFPGGRNVPSKIVLEILSNPAIPYPAILLESC